MRYFKRLLTSNNSSYISQSLLVIVLVIIIWEGIIRLCAIEKYILPAPSDILVTLESSIFAILRHSWQTFITTMSGFFLSIIVGIILGLIISYCKGAYRLVYPILVGFNTIPKVALVPLLAIWFGIGTVPAIITSFLLAFFPIVVNVNLGLTTVEPEMKDMMRSLGASQLEIFQKVEFPHTLPYLFASFKVAISFAFIGSVISEMIASNNIGIGYLICFASSQFNMPLAFLGLLVLSVMGICLYSLLVLLEQFLIPWKSDPSSR